MKAQKTPARTCIGCRTTSDKREFVRFVRSPEGHIELDATGRASGRGAYVCSQRDCFELAYKGRRFASALRVSLNEDDYDRLRRDFFAHISSSATE